VSDIKDLPVFLPPIEEQQDIIDDLSEMDRRITSVVNNIEKSIILHQEKRKTILTDAVTGQIDLKLSELSQSQEQTI
jgi:type I restriction enzyme S subunit